MVIAMLTLAMLGIVGFATVAVQQYYRMAANDPQVQMAEDAAAQLAGGSQPSTVVPGPPTVDPSKSLSPFLMVVDSNGKLLAGNMQLEGTAGTPPLGVLTAANSHQNRRTWQPQTGVRIALVVQKYAHGNTTGYVLAGRSLSEIESRVDILYWMAFAAGLWVLVMGGLAALLTKESR